MSHRSAHDLLLYHTEFCPYCVKVRRYVDANHIDLPMKDLNREPDARRELLNLGGKIQVPALRIDGKILYESDDIIHWLSQWLSQWLSEHTINSVH